MDMVSIEDEIPNIPKEFTLYQNYPNPFNPVTSIGYDLPRDTNVKITVFDMMGRLVNTLIDGQKTAGHGVTRWDGTNNKGQAVGTGSYIYIMESGQVKRTKKMILIK